jgi:hypothetical protein
MIPTWGPQRFLLTKYQGLFQGVKRPELGVDRSPPFSAEVNNVWMFTSTSSHAFMLWNLSTGASLPFSLTSSMFTFFRKLAGKTCYLSQAHGRTTLM